MKKQLPIYQIGLAILFLFALNQSYAQLTMIDVAPGPPSSFASDFEVVGPLIFFSAEDVGGDKEPHFFDPAMGGPPIKIDINPAGDSTPAEFTWVPGITTDFVFFSAEDASGDRELYFIDLMFMAPVKVDIDPAGSSMPFRLTNLGGTLFFTATAAGDKEAYYYDGAMPVKIDTDPAGSGDPEEYTFAGGEAFFVATVAGDEELYNFDGVTLTKIDVNPSASSDPNELTTLGSDLYFNAESTTGDKELHVYDTSMSMVTEIDVSATGSSSPFALYNADGVLYFTASDMGDVEMYEYDPAGPTLSKIDIDPAGSSFPAIFPGNYKKVGGFIYVPAEIEATGDRELYKFDIGMGTTTKVDVNPIGPSAPLELTELDGILYFTADEGPDKELYQYDGTTLVKLELNPVGSGDAGGLTPAPGALFLKGTDGFAGLEMWEYVDMPLSTDSFDQNDQIRIYPNPLSSGSNLYIKSNGVSSIDTISIFDMNGTRIQTIETSGIYNNFSVQLNNYASGIYLIKLESESSNIIRKLVID